MSIERENFPDKAVEKSDERLAGGRRSGVVAPALSIAIVGSYGFAIWISQIFFGPPVQ